MDTLDPKEIGLAIKDIVLGVGTVAAGVVGGPAAAGGVQQAGTGLDRVFGMAGLGTARAQQFDRADFSARRNSAPHIPRAPTEVPSSEPVGGRSQPPGKDAQIALAHLRSLGWPDAAAQQILDGPERRSGLPTDPDPVETTEEVERWKQTLDQYQEQSRKRRMTHGGLGKSVR